MSHFTALPSALQELSTLRQWIVRRADKIPLRCDGTPASVTNPNDWSTFPEALSACAADSSLGLGFVLSETDGLSCIDLDASEDPSVIKSQAEIYSAFNSYAERSPSGKGCHIWVRGKVASKRLAAKKLEVYSRARYMTVTCDVVNDAPIQPRQALLDDLVLSIDAASVRRAPEGPVMDEPGKWETFAVVNKVAQSHPHLWNCDPNEATDRSKVDFQLCKEIAKISRNQQQTFEVFMQSPRSRTPRNKTGQDRMKCVNRPDWVRDTIVEAFKDIDWLAENLQRDGVKIGIDKGIPIPPKAKPGRKVTFKRGYEIADAAIDWLWEEYLPRGMFTMLAGEAGTGKSTITCALTSTITNGGTWPDGTKCAKPGNVLIWSSEDSEEHVIKPRLVAAGANEYGYATIESTIDDSGKKKPFDPSQDIEMLEEACLEIGNVALIIIDPILAVVNEDANAANKVRAALAPTVALAKKLNCAVIGISHFAKGSEKRAPVDRVLNSQAFTALARMNLAAAKDETTGDCVLTRIKTNISKPGEGFAYSLEQLTYKNSTEETIKTQKVVWGEQLTGSAREVLQSVAYDEKQQNKLAPESIEAARRFIHGKLWNGQKVLAVQMVGEAHEAQINEYALGRARKLLNVKQGPLEFGGRHYWYIQ